MHASPVALRALHVEPVIEQAHDQLQMALRLHQAAADAEQRVQRIAAQDHPGNDRVERPLARRKPVRMARIEREARAAVLHHEAESLGDMAAAEVREHAVDERNAVAFAVDDARYTVSERPHAFAWGTDARQPAGARTSSSSRSIGTSAKRGSATWRCASTIACFVASISRCQHSGESRRCRARSTADTARSASNAARPWPFGGHSSTR